MSWHKLAILSSAVSIIYIIGCNNSPGKTQPESSQFAKDSILDNQDIGSPMEAINNGFEGLNSECSQPIQTSNAPVAAEFKCRNFDIEGKTVRSSEQGDLKWKLGKPMLISTKIKGSNTKNKKSRWSFDVRIEGDSIEILGEEIRGLTIYSSLEVAGSALVQFVDFSDITIQPLGGEIN